MRAAYLGVIGGVGWPGGGADTRYPAIMTPQCWQIPSLSTGRKGTQRGTHGGDRAQPHTPAVAPLTSRTISASHSSPLPARSGVLAAGPPVITMPIAAAVSAHLPPPCHSRRHRATADSMRHCADLTKASDGGKRRLKSGGNVAAAPPRCTPERRPFSEPPLCTAFVAERDSAPELAPFSRQSLRAIAHGPEATGQVFHGAENVADHAIRYCRAGSWCAAIR